MISPSDSEVPLTDRALKREVLAHADRPTLHARGPHGERIIIPCVSMEELRAIIAVAEVQR